MLTAFLSRRWKSWLRWNEPFRQHVSRFGYWHGLLCQFPRKPISLGTDSTLFVTEPKQRFWMLKARTEVHNGAASMCVYVYIYIYLYRYIGTSNMCAIGPTYSQWYILHNYAHTYDLSLCVCMFKWYDAVRQLFLCTCFGIPWHMLSHSACIPTHTPAFAVADVCWHMVWHVKWCCAGMSSCMPTILICLIFLFECALTCVLCGYSLHETAKRKFC